MTQKLRYRLALDLGSTSLGWALIRLNASDEPCAVIRAGVRIFSDGRNPKDGLSLAVTRREARAMRRRRDRLLKRKNRLILKLVEHGFWPADPLARKELESLNPYALRAKGLDEALTPAEFGRALFHINQRRGFKSNRKTDKKENDSGALKSAIKRVREQLTANQARTVGEWLHQRMAAGQPVRARYRQTPFVNAEGKRRIDKSYDLYVERAMVEAEFDAIWAKQAALNPAAYTDAIHKDLKDTLLFQRNLRPVKPGRCTLLPDEERAPLALPSTQRFRLLQEANNLRVIQEGLQERPLTLAERDKVAAALEQKSKVSFTAIKKLLGLGGATQFNLEDPKRQDLKGNVTSAILGDKKHFGAAWHAWPEAKQDDIVLKLLNEENESALVAWLQAETGVDEATAEAVANVSGLPEGYGSLSAKALGLIVPQLRAQVQTYDKAVVAAGFDHHSHLGNRATGEIWPELPYYGEPLQRFVGFGTGAPEDPPEKRFGRIANPTVHIGLNQVRVVVNALIKRYGHPSQVIVEVARDLKQSREQRQETQQQQAANQERNKRYRAMAAEVMGISEERVTATDLQKLILWHELSHNEADRRCPYSGAQIGVHMLFSDEVEIEHILPFSRTLDDSLNNKTVALRTANRAKGNQTPWEAFGNQAQLGYDYPAILQRAELMPRNKRYRFAQDGLERWDREGKGFLARALNDTRYLSRVARQYVALVCPQDTRVIPGQMTAMLRGKFGLNKVLGEDGEKNRNDHRHHAVDACVIGVTDQGMLQRFAQANARAREAGLNRLVDNMPDPWPTYREHVKRAINAIWVSHKPDHSFEGGMHNDTAYGLLGGGQVSVHKREDGLRVREVAALKVIEFADKVPLKADGSPRHGLLLNGEPAPYKGYKGDSNYCIEIVRGDNGKWEGEVVSTFQAYQLVRSFAKREDGLAKLRHPRLALSGRPLVMRLMIDDMIRLKLDGRITLMRIASVNSAGRLSLAEIHEANVDARNRDSIGTWRYAYKQAGSLQKAQGRRVTVSPIGDLHDPGFRP
jgi:CRISPR-associated endonuclease Csn1